MVKPTPVVVVEPDRPVTPMATWVQALMGYTSELLEAAEAPEL
jgi:hypothetical protein